MEYSKEECLSIYKKLLDGKIKRSPVHFWNENNLKITIRYIFDDILKWNQQEILENAKIETFIKYKLRNPIRYKFNNHISKAINLAYETNYKEWQFKKVPSGFWNDRNNIDDAMNWLSDKLKIPKEELQPKDLVKNNLIGLHNYIINNKIEVFKNKGIKNGRTNERIYKLGPRESKRFNIPKEWSSQIFNNGDKAKLYIANNTIFVIDGTKDRRDIINKVCDNFYKIDRPLTKNEITYLSYIIETKIEDKFKEIKIVLENEVYKINKKNLKVTLIEKS